jgi:hypothetical protein
VSPAPWRKISAHNVAAVVDPVSKSSNCTRVVDWNEISAILEKSVCPTACDIARGVPADDLALIVDPVRLRDYAPG